MFIPILKWLWSNRSWSPKTNGTHPDKLSEATSRLGASFSGDGLGGLLDGVQGGLHVVLVHGDAMGVLEDDGAGFRAVAWKYGDSYSFGTLAVEEEEANQDI